MSTRETTCVDRYRTPEEQGRYTNSQRCCFPFLDGSSLSPLQFTDLQPPWSLKSSQFDTLVRSTEEELSTGARLCRVDWISSHAYGLMGRRARRTAFSQYDNCFQSPWPSNAREATMTKSRHYTHSVLHRVALGFNQSNRPPYPTRFDKPLPFGSSAHFSPSPPLPSTVSCLAHAPLLEQ